MNKLPDTATNPKPAVTCQTCGQGALVKRKKYRMSVPVVVIGYILLVPSVIGLLLGSFILISMGPPSKLGELAPASQVHEERKRLEAQAIPDQIIAQVVSSKPVPEDELSTLTPQQASAVQQSQRSVAAANSTGGQFFGSMGNIVIHQVFLGITVTSFVGGVLGWLLVMKKKVLQCEQCGAVVAAS